MNNEDQKKTLYFQRDFNIIQSYNVVSERKQLRLYNETLSPPSLKSNKQDESENLRDMNVLCIVRVAFEKIERKRKHHLRLRFQLRLRLVNFVTKGVPYEFLN